MAQMSTSIPAILQEEGANFISEMGAYIVIQEVILDLDISGQNITAQKVRKSCFLAISETGNATVFEEALEDVPLGKIFACVNENVNWAPEETAKVIINSKLTEDETKILTYINTQQDETVLKPGDDGYSEICTCYPVEGANADGSNAIPCDGEEEDTDVIVDEDTVTDEDSLLF